MGEETDHAERSPRRSGPEVLIDTRETALASHAAGAAAIDEAAANDNLETLVDAEDRLRLEGFDHEFHFTADGRLADTVTDVVYESEQVEVVATHREEGLSDPGDESLLMALRAPDGVRGQLVTRYGQGAPDADALRRLGTRV